MNDMTSDKTHNVTASGLRPSLERIEGLEATKKDVAARIKEVDAATKARGFRDRALAL